MDEGRDAFAEWPTVSALRESSSRATLRRSVRRSVSGYIHLLSSSLFIIPNFACVAEQRKHSTVDRASLVGLRRCESYRRHDEVQSSMFNA